ncbi:MAG: GntR family transcriptional regulator [Rhodobacteraceae bacterium]|nr:MAG: GntR family transcriptional regulator [Paracoccaceae bacterium]
MNIRSNITISDQIQQTLTDQIVRGELAPDEKLRQDHIAKDFNTSHVPVREALLRLEARGLAVSIPRRGVRVAPFHASDILEIKAMRLALEPVALRHAIPKMTAADLARIKTAQQACDDAGDLLTWEQTNRQFHRAILVPCMMPLLLSTIDKLQVLGARHLLATWRSTWEGRTDRDHSAIWTAIIRKDSDTAVSVLKKHLQRLG